MAASHLPEHLLIILSGVHPVNVYPVFFISLLFLGILLGTGDMEMKTGLMEGLMCGQMKTSWPHKLSRREGHRGSSWGRVGGRLLKAGGKALCVF